MAGDILKAAAGDPIAQVKIGAKVGFLGCGVVLMISTLLFVTAFDKAAPEKDAPGENTIPGSYSSKGGDLANANALTLEQLRNFLNSYPNAYKLRPYAEQIYNAAQKFHINPLFALAIANKDSSMGTAGAGKTCRNPGNISHRSDNYRDSGIRGLGRCSDVYGGSERWEAFSTYGDGMQAKMWLLRVNYIDKGYDTIKEIIYRYAPPVENDSAQYVKDVIDFMNKYSQ